MSKSVLSLVLAKIAGFLFILVLLGIASYFSRTVSNPDGSLEFFNSNLGLFAITALLLFFAELFLTFRYPANLLYPLFNAAASIYFISFFMGLLIDNFTDAGFSTIVILQPFFRH
ncbi:MAG TPA: hypothetical protein VFF28_03095 [Candidatus Nanoarchaeia archaeon]|nr:hypothetical protein [Candidatus Nanoarchaeia archaeon]